MDRNSGRQVVIKATGEIGTVEQTLGDGQLLIMVPRFDGWPFPKWVSAFPTEVKRAPKSEPEHERALL